MQQKESFAEWVINSLRRKEKVNVYSDVYFAPVLVNFLGETIIKMHEKDLSGIYNVASERSTRLEFAMRLAGIFKLDKSLIIPTPCTNPLIPKDSSLDLTKIEEAGLAMPSTDDGIKQMRFLEGLFR